MSSKVEPPTFFGAAIIWLIAVIASAAIWLRQQGQRLHGLTFRALAEQ
jgi:hypothetical protein